MGWANRARHDNKGDEQRIHNPKGLAEHDLFLLLKERD
jgi:hypothetical protein